MLAAGDKPNFHSFQINHKCAFHFPGIWKVVNEWGGGGQTNSCTAPVNPAHPWHGCLRLAGACAPHREPGVCQCCLIFIVSGTTKYK
jgi:hypothetical protein